MRITQHSRSLLPYFTRTHSLPRLGQPGKSHGQRKTLASLCPCMPPHPLHHLQLKLTKELATAPPLRLFPCTQKGKHSGSLQKAMRGECHAWWATEHNGVRGWVLSRGIELELSPLTTWTAEGPVRRKGVWSFSCCLLGCCTGEWMDGFLWHGLWGPTWTPWHPSLKMNQVPLLTLSLALHFGAIWLSASSPPARVSFVT